MEPHAVIFDRDLTLVYLAPDKLADLERQMQAIAPSLRFREVYVALEQWDGYLPTDVSEEVRLWADLVGRLAACHSLDDGQQAALITLLTPYHDYFAAYPDSVSTVRHLHAHGYLLVLFTNAPLPSVARTLASAGIDPSLFTLIESRASLGRAKPDPKVFLELAARLGLPPTACTVIDDQLIHVEVARTIGMAGWHLERSEPAISHLGTIASLAQIVVLMDSR
jgi:HAD superfamily hydrolase (TIGR01509 family)